MTKLQIGWKAKDINGIWYMFLVKPRIWELTEKWVIMGHARIIKDHPEQPETNWEDSLELVYIEVEC